MALDLDKEILCFLTQTNYLMMSEKVRKRFLAAYLLIQQQWKKGVIFSHIWLCWKWDLFFKEKVGLMIYKILNQKKAFDLCWKSWGRWRFLSEDLIKKFYEIIMEGIMPGGVYRNVDIRIQGSSHVPTNYMRVYQKMEEFNEEIKTITDPIYLASFVHGRLDKIHPFLDGNGRCSRLVVNYVLVKNNLLPISVNEKDKREYFDALEEYKVNRNFDPLITLFSRLENERLDLYYNEIKSLERN